MNSGSFPSRRTRSHSRRFRGSYQFEEFLSDLSTKFASLPYEQIDREVELGLQKLVKFLKTDRAGIVIVREHDVGVPYIWARPGVPLDGGYSLNYVPWFRENLRTGVPMILQNLPDDLPEEAVAEREYCRTRGMKSIAAIPIFVGGTFFGAISTASFQRTRKLSKRTLTRLTLIGEVFANALSRKRSAQKIRDHISTLEKQYQFEKLISDVSAKIVMTPQVELDQMIERTLEQLVVLFHMDRLALLKVSGDRQTAKVTHSANGPEIPSAPTNINYVEHFPWHSRKAIAQQVVSLNTKDLPPEADVDRQSAHSMGILSNLVVPLNVDGSLEYVFAANYVRNEKVWDHETISRIRLLGEMFANSLARRQSGIDAQRNRDELARISRVSAAGELAASIAHELNQPLTGILTNAQAAIRLFPDIQSAELQEIKEILTEIIEDDVRAGKIIQNLRSIVQKTEVEFVYSNINEMIRVVVSLVRSDAILKNISIEERLSESLPSTRGDRIQLQQVLLNLLLNSMDAIADAPFERRRIVVSSTDGEPGWVNVTVKDFGKGIPADEMSKIFNPFYTTKREGMGMGLSISRTIIELHGGKLWAETDPDPGVAFRFKLPVPD